MSLSENNDPSPSERQPNKRRRKKSIVWEHFTVETVSAGCARACCKQCKQTFAYSTGSKLAGTSHLKRHIALGTCLASLRKEKNQLSRHTPNENGSAYEPSRKRSRESSFSVNFPFDNDLCRREIAKMIIMHEYPLDMVEHPAFLSFVHNLQPHFNMVKLDKVQRDCMEIYHRERQEVVKLLCGISGRISLSVDMRTSNQTLGYVFLTAHFINNGWQLQRRILNVVTVPSYHSKGALNHAVGVCIRDWGLESKLFSIAYNKCLLGDDVGTLKGYLSVRNPLILNGQLLVEHCYANVLSSIAQNALEGMWEPINKVRESMKYIKTSQAHERLFLDIKQELQIPDTKYVFLDDRTQWNTTYLMLVSAMELRGVFSCLEAADSYYKLCPCIDDWRQVEALCTYLKLLYDASNVLCSTLQPTADVYFHEMLKVELELIEAAMSQDPLICNVTIPLKEMFEIYWKKCSLPLAIAVAMDPRFKMKFVELSFSKVYGDDARTYIDIVYEGIQELFSEYEMQLLPPTPTHIPGNIGSVKIEEPLQVFSDIFFPSEYLPLDFDVCISDGPYSEQTLLELDMYLEGAVVPQTRDFDILSWWKLNSHKYPTLSKMARDILCIQMSTVGSESVFHTEGRQIDRCRSSLRPEVLQALICSKDWLSHEPADPKNELVKMEISF